MAVAVAVNTNGLSICQQQSVRVVVIIYYQITPVTTATINVQIAYLLTCSSRQPACQLACLPLLSVLASRRSEPRMPFLPPPAAAAGWFCGWLSCSSSVSESRLICCLASSLVNVKVGMPLMLERTSPSRRHAVSALLPGFTCKCVRHRGVKL